MRRPYRELANFCVWVERLLARSLAEVGVWLSLVGGIAPMSQAQDLLHRIGSEVRAERLCGSPGIGAGTLAMPGVS